MAARCEGQIACGQRSGSPEACALDQDFVVGNCFRYVSPVFRGNVDKTSLSACLNDLVARCGGSSFDPDWCFVRAVPKKPEGSTCRSQFECDRLQGLFCSKPAGSSGCSAGTCERIPDAGQPCTNGSTCAYGLCCGGGTCAQPSAGGCSLTHFEHTQALGAPCTYNGDCVPGALCRQDSQTCADEGELLKGCPPPENELAGTTGLEAVRCRKLAGAGEPCGSSAAATCKDGLTCNDTTDTCQPKQLPKQGEPCSGGFPPCGQGLWCSGNVCAPQASEGAPCASSEACGQGLSCDGGSCAKQTKRKGLGAACGGGGECYSGVCEAGGCADLCP